MQPALAVACDICRGVTDDHYTVGDRIICAGCWDPFGTLDAPNQMHEDYVRKSRQKREGK